MSTATKVGAMYYGVFNPDQDKMSTLQNEGHIITRGHPMTGYWKPTGDGLAVTLVLTCCEE